MAKANFTSINVVMDKSGSMSSLRDDTIGSFNQFLTEQQSLTNDETIFSLALFNDKYEMVYDCVPITEVKPLTSEKYSPDGWTALHDAVAKTINNTSAKFKAMKEEDRPSKIILVVITDGHENSSREFNAAKVRTLLDLHQSEYKWQVVYLGAGSEMFDTKEQAMDMGFTKSSSYSYNSTQRGTQSLYSNASFSVANYRLGNTMSLCMDQEALISNKIQDVSSLINTDTSKVSSASTLVSTETMTVPSDASVQTNTASPDNK